MKMRKQANVWTRMTAYLPVCSYVYERNVIVPVSGSMDSMMARLSTW